MSNEDAWQQAYEQALALRQERDAAIAERDRLRRELEDLRRELRGRIEAHQPASTDPDILYWFRGEARGRMHEAQYVSGRLDAILRGES